MPGNGVGDRVHNFFAQENLSQGLRSEDGNWPLNDNLWGVNQKQFGVSDSSPRNYNPQQPETERGHSGQHVPDQYIFNVTQTNARPEFARSLSQSHHEQPSSNGYMYGHHNFQRRPDEANFMGVNTDYGHNNVNRRSSLFSESQQEPVPEQPSKNPFRLESSEVHGSFDLFGGQNQTNSQHPGIPQQPLQQQSGFGDIQQLQQQLMLRKMQELQRQQHVLNHTFQFARQQNTLNQSSQFSRQQASGSLSHGLANETPTSDSSGYGWTEPAMVNPSWLHHASPVSHPEQQIEPSLHGVPVSSSRGPISQFPHSNLFPGNNYAVIPEQHMVPNKGLFGNTFGQRSNSMKNMEHIQKINAPQNPSVQESPVEMAQNKLATDAAPLDPEEEKILFGSDDNIWEAFGGSKNMAGGVSSLLDDNEFASGLPSMQSGRWSALMQSAVAETSSGGDVSVKEEWPDLNFQNPEPPPGKHPYENIGKQQTPTALTDSNLPNIYDKHHRNKGFKHSPGVSNSLHSGLQKTDAEENQLHENSVPGQTTPQLHETSHLDKQANNWNANKPVPTSVNSGFIMSENDNSLQQSQNNDWKKVNTAVLPHLSNMQQGDNLSNQFTTNNYHPNYWKDVDSLVKSKGSENSDITQRHLNSIGPQVSGSSFNSSDMEDLNNSRKEYSNISPQMAPSWFDRYGTLKSGHMSSQRADAVRTMAQPCKVSGSLETTHDAKQPPASGVANTSQDNFIRKTPVPPSLVVDHHLTFQPLQPSITAQNLVTIKKRKWSRDEIPSWLKEVSGRSKNLQGIWTAMMEWCEATKRLMEKVENDGELIEDVPRPKRRIILATQLMQQLFPPPPHTLISSEATLNYESVAFYAARLALGDACNLVSCVSQRESNLLSNKSRESEKIDDNRFSEAVVDCMSKAKRAESDFSRLDERASILDLRVECRDVEKFAIINRFAKFHGRGQADGKTSSLSDAVANAPKPFPQRYVIAVPLTKNLPERVQCLSL